MQNWFGMICEMWAVSKCSNIWFLVVISTFYSLIVIISLSSSHLLKMKTFQCYPWVFLHFFHNIVRHCWQLQLCHHCILPQGGWNYGSVHWIFTKMKTKFWQICAIVVQVEGTKWNLQRSASACIAIIEYFIYCSSNIRIVFKSCVWCNPSRGMVICPTGNRTGDLECSCKVIVK